MQIAETAVATAKLNVFHQVTRVSLSQGETMYAKTGSFRRPFAESAEVGQPSEPSDIHITYLNDWLMA